MARTRASIRPSTPEREERSSKSTEEITSLLYQIKDYLSSQVSQQPANGTISPSALAVEGALWTSTGNKGSKRDAFANKVKHHVERTEQDLCAKLKKRGMSTKSELNTIFRKHARAALADVKNRRATVQNAIKAQSSGQSASHASACFDDSLSTMFQQWLKSEASNIVSRVDEENAKASGGNRARVLHDPTAVAILEYAFERCPVPTRAERRYLEELTGLEPRQVLIFMQNRRHRRSSTHADGSYTTSASSISSTSPVAVRQELSTSFDAAPQPEHHTMAQTTSTLTPVGLSAAPGMLALAAPYGWSEGLVPDDNIPITGNYEFTFNLEALGLPNIPATWRFHTS